MLMQNKVADLFRDYYGELTRFVAAKFNVSGEVDDIVQDVFHRVLLNDNVDDIENPRAYLYQAARNIALNKLKRRGFQNDYLSTLNPSEEYSLHLEREVLAQFDVEAVKETIKKLSEKDRQTFLLNRIEGKNYRQISEELNITVSAVEKRMMKVLNLLRAAIDEYS